MGLTGSKLGCAEGGCGACTVLISKKDGTSGNIKHISVNACLMPILAADGCHVTTVEGIGTVRGDNLHPIQKAMVEMHGSQCGFCTRKFWELWLVLDASLDISSHFFSRVTQLVLLWHSMGSLPTILPWRTSKNIWMETSVVALDIDPFGTRLGPFARTPKNIW
jgi:hypothetical protein